MRDYALERMASELVEHYGEYYVQKLAEEILSQLVRREKEREFESAWQSERDALMEEMANLE